LRNVFLMQLSERSIRQTTPKCSRLLAVSIGINLKPKAGRHTVIWSKPLI
jgi:hypothetical protein